MSGGALVMRTSGAGDQTIKITNMGLLMYSTGTPADPYGSAGASYRNPAATNWDPSGSI